MAAQLRPFVRAKVDFFSPEKKPDHIRSLPELIDFNAIHNPDHIFCIQAQPDNSFVRVTCRQFKEAIDRCAWWMVENKVAQNGDNKRTPVALLMESDLGLLIHQFALLSLGIPPLVLSARLSPEAIFHLLKSTGAQGIIVSQRISEHPAFSKAKAFISFHVRLPYSALHSVDAAPVDSLTVYPDDVDSEILWLHSSGTTGLPKPIALTHRQLVFAVSHGEFDTEEEAQGINISTLPLFHGFGLLAPGLAMAVGKTVCFPSPDRFANAQYIMELVKQCNAASMMTVPFLLEDIISSLLSGEGIRALATLDFVATGGSALSVTTGDTLVRNGVRLLNLYGTTETGPLTKTFAPKDNYNWKYFRLRTDMLFDIAELESSFNGERRFRLTVFPFGASKPQEIADQLIRNEEFPDTDFAAVGRDDDVIVLATGEKVNPLLLEMWLVQTGLAKSAIVFGADRFEIGVIVEPVHPISEEKEWKTFKDKIWEIIVQANERMDSTAQICSPSYIIIVPPGMVMPRTDKGSIARKEVYQLFEAHIDLVYENAERSAIHSRPLDYENLEDSVKELIQTRLSLQTSKDSWNFETNLFDLGLNSLQATILRRILLSAAWQTPHEVIGRDFIYVNPSVRDIANTLRNQASTSRGPENESPGEEVERFVRLYTTRNIIVKDGNHTTGMVVLLTGSSGSLGSHVLAELVRSSVVARVICLLRKGASGSIAPGSIPGKAHRLVLESRGIELSDYEWSKVSIQEYDPTQQTLGLAEQDYTTLAGSITHVLHAAWPMNFHMRLSSFTNQFTGLKNLIHLTLSRRHSIRPSRKIRFVFISSIATLANLGLANAGQIVPETSLSVDGSACGNGYADAKLVCEKILEEAALLHNTQLEVCLVRCGQLTGSKKTGAWNPDEQIPILTASWIPVDDAATAISEILLMEDTPSLVVHVENPVRQAWSDLMSIIGKELGISKSIAFDEWLEKVDSQKRDIDEYPAKKLSEFFKHQFRIAACGTIIMGTDVARQYSSKLRDLTALDEAIVTGYIRYWRETGYLK